MQARRCTFTSRLGALQEGKVVRAAGHKVKERIRAKEWASGPRMMMMMMGLPTPTGRQPVTRPQALKRRRREGDSPAVRGLNGAVQPRLAVGAWGTQVRRAARGAACAIKRSTAVGQKWCLWWTSCQRAMLG